MNTTMTAWTLLSAADARRLMAGTNDTRERFAARYVDDIGVAARTGAPVLITGGSAAERDACARFIHASGSLARGPFVPHSHRFATRPGPLEDVETLRHQFEQARGGTLYIDDVASLTPGAQCELLLELESNHGCAPVRVISGTDGPIDARRAASLFDDVLFYRLNVIRIDLGAAAKDDGWKPCDS
jgi:DNA-binding NtrC family response regulator